MAPSAIQDITLGSEQIALGSLTLGQYAQTPRLYPVLLKEPWVNYPIHIMYDRCQHT